MTDYFKTIREYLRGKWGLRSAPDTFRRHRIPSNVEIVGCGTLNGEEIQCSVTETIDLTGGYASWRKEVVAGDAQLTLVSSSLGSTLDFTAQCLRDQIARLKRNKKKHSHLQKQLDDLLNGGAQISDQQTETTK